MPWLLGSPQLSEFLLSSCLLGGRASRAVWWGAAQVPCLFHKLHVLARVRNWWPFEPGEVTDNAALCIPKSKALLFCCKLIGTDAYKIHPCYACSTWFLLWHEGTAQAELSSVQSSVLPEQESGWWSTHSIWIHHDRVLNVHPGFKKKMFSPWKGV